MTETRAHGRQSRGRRYSSLSLGEEFWDALTVTETHVVLAAGIFNDPGPIHLNRLQAERGRFGAQVAHGTLLSGVMVGVVGNALGPTIVAMLELSARWLRPTFLGDTLISRWEIVDLVAKPTFAGGGIVTFAGEAMNQQGETLMESRLVLAVGEEAPWDAASHVAEKRRRREAGGASE